MEAKNDYKELLALLNANEVRHLIIGAHALAFRGAPRYTGDLDILVQPDTGSYRHCYVDHRRIMG